MDFPFAKWILYRVQCILTRAKGVVGPVPTIKAQHIFTGSAAKFEWHGWGWGNVGSLYVTIFSIRFHHHFLLGTIFFPERPKGKRIGCDSDAFYVKRRLIELVAFQKVGSCCCCCFCCWVVYRHHCPPIAPVAAQMKSQSKTRWCVG